MCVCNIHDKFVGSNGEHITYKRDIYNGFNDFFVNVAPYLANTIKVPEGTQQDVFFSIMRDPVNQSMLIKPVIEQNVVYIVKCNKKTSGDSFG